MGSARVIVDTNVLISYLLSKNSPAGLAATRVFAETQPLASEATLTELADVLARSRFDIVNVLRISIKTACDTPDSQFKGLNRQPVAFHHPGAA